MRCWVAAAVVVVVCVVGVVVVEPRPQQQHQHYHQEKRGVRLCSARDVKLIATYVCNLHRRSVRSVALDENSEGDTYIMPGVGGSSVILPWRSLPPCDGPDGDCGGLNSADSPVQQTQRASPPQAPFNMAKRWYALHRFGTAKGMQAEKENDITEDYRADSNSIDYAPSLSGALPLSELFPENVSKFIRVNYPKYVTSLLPHKGKRDKEMSLPVVVPRSLSAIRQDCCVKECNAEDFFGACS